MDKSDLQAKLEQLHAELENTKTIDPEARQLLEHLRSDIQAMLKEPNASTRRSLNQRLNAALAQFEESHPSLTLTIQQVLDHLSNV